MKSQLEVVRRWLGYKERAAVRIMEAARTSQDSARQQLDEILAMRAEYHGLLNTQIRNGAGAEQLRVFHQFLQSLEGAAGAQRARLTAEQQTFERASANWLRVYRERYGIDTVIGRRADAARRLANKRADRAVTDRHAFTRRAAPGGTDEP